MTREEMREKVAQLFCGGNNPCDACFKDADAAIAIIRGETLEEAANAVGYLRWQDVDPFDGRTLGHAVVAIRALKDKP